MKKLSLLLALICPWIGSTAFAAERNMRPGLWQITTSSDLLRLAPHLSADQMQNIKEMAAEYGLEMPEIQQGAAISKTCITPEMAQQKTLPTLYQEQAGCVSSNAKRQGDRYSIDFSCHGANIEGQGSAQALLTSTESFTGQTHFKGSAQGAPVDEKADISGKWIGPDCNKMEPNNTH